MLTSSFRHLDNNCTYSLRALRKKSIDTSSKGEMKGGKRSAEEAKIIGERQDEEKKEVEDRKEEGEDEAGASGNCNLTVCCLL